MGRAYYTSRGNDKCMQTIGRATSRERAHEMKHGWEDNIKTDFKELMYAVKWDVVVWTGSSWFRIGTGGGHL
jgi:hypothetical protein